VIIALLVGCVLRRQELTSLKMEDIQLREERWVIIDLRGKGGRIRTVAVPIWVKQGIDAWIAAARIEKGGLLRALSKSGKMVGDELGDWAIWSVVEQYRSKSESNTPAHVTSAAPAPSFAERTGAIWNRSNSCSATPRYRPPNAISVPSRRSPLP
jgi:integrase